MKIICQGALIRIGLVMASLAVTGPARADAVIEAVPSSWRLQDYLDGPVYTWYTGSPCGNGLLVLPASVPADSKNRYWSLVTTAKVANRIIGVYYVNNSGTCTITNFYLREQ